MVKRLALLSFSALTMLAGYHVSATAAVSDAAPAASEAAATHDCAGSPSDAVMTLPAPLSRWAQIVCTPFGHMLASRKGWMWLAPDLDPVFIPAQAMDNNPEKLGNKIYFTKVDVARVKGTEFADAYKTFHEGFDDSEVKPDGYRVDLTTVQGNTIRMYFFDYDTYAWGMSCPDNKCDPDTRFMVLDRSTPPKPREPSI
ncbi:MAG TPA: hypothetical protein VFW28_01175 [Micropepsaceae bacterium]|nr:hypothetical protein [Micropepsaceae bacterium]